VGTAEVSSNPEVAKAAQEMKEELTKARKF